MYDINSRELAEGLNQGYEKLKENLASGTVPIERYQFILGTLNAYRHFMQIVAEHGEKADYIRNNRG